VKQSGNLLHGLVPGLLIWWQTFIGVLSVFVDVCCKKMRLFCAVDETRRDLRQTRQCANLSELDVVVFLVIICEVFSIVGSDSCPRASLLTSCVVSF
jgi:hypothetical protein